MPPVRQGARQGTRHDDPEGEAGRERTGEARGDPPATHPTLQPEDAGPPLLRRPAEGRRGAGIGADPGLDARPDPGIRRQGGNGLGERGEAGLPAHHEGAQGHVPDEGLLEGPALVGGQGAEHVFARRPLRILRPGGHGVSPHTAAHAASRQPRRLMRLRRSQVLIVFTGLSCRAASSSRDQPSQ